MMDEFPSPARYNVIAKVNDMNMARDVIQKLVRDGIDASRIALVGSAVVEAELRTGRGTAEEEDFGGARYVGKRVALWGMGGVLLGALFGAVIALGIGWKTGYLATAMIAGALALGAVGGMIGGVSALPLTDEWTRTFRTVGRQDVVLALRSDNKRDYERATSVLDDVPDVEIQRYVRRGGKLRAA